MAEVAKQLKTDDSDEEIVMYKRQIRESIYKIHLHSVKQPLHEQTHYKQTIAHEENSSSEANSKLSAKFSAENNLPDHDMDSSKDELKAISKGQSACINQNSDLQES